MEYSNNSEYGDISNRFFYRTTLVAASELKSNISNTYLNKILKIATQTKQILQILLFFCTLLTSRKRKLMRRNDVLSLFNIKCISWSNTANYVVKTWLNSNLILATQILTKTKRSYFYILIIAIQTKQKIISYIKENLKKTDEKKCSFKCI